MEYFKDEKDLLNKLRKKLFEEYEKYENLNQQTLITKTEPINTNNNYNIISNEYLNNKDDNKQQPLEFSYADFLKEFKSNLLNKKDNKLISLNDVNVTFKEDFSNVNEYTELNLTKNNIGLLKRNIVTSSVENNEFNIYNNYGIITTDTKNLQTEVDNEGVPIGTNEPFNIDVTKLLIESSFSYSKDFLHIKHLCFISKGLNSLLHVLQKTLLLEMKYNSLLHFSHFILSFITALQ